MAGVSERGHVVLGKGRYISLLRGPQCDTAARIELPPEVGNDCRKAVDTSGRVLVQAKEDADTISLDSEGLKIYRSNTFGLLITCIEDMRCYRERIIVASSKWKKFKDFIAGTRNYRIRLQRGADGEALYLEPPGRWDHGLSVCRHNNGTYWVTDGGTDSLDIFTTAGQQRRRRVIDITLKFITKCSRALRILLISPVFSIFPFASFSE
jgi:hypothetical protein